MIFIRIPTTKFVFALILFLAFSSGASAGGTLFVDDDAAPGGDGASWDTAYRFLQDALEDAAGGGVDEIRVAKGLYKPDHNEANIHGTANRETAFQLPQGLALVGGYAGIGAKNPDARDYNLYQTILSGEIGDNALSTDNSFHVLSASGAKKAVLLDGFFVTAGVASGASPNNRGAGMIIDNGIAEVANCTFYTNRSSGLPDQVAAAGAISSSASNLTLTNCTFINNLVSGINWTSILGGGAISASNSTITGSNCRFIINKVITSLTDGPSQGGAMRISSSTVLTLTDCWFVKNEARKDFFPTEAGSGGGLYIWQSTAMLTNCVFVGNRTPSEDGGTGRGAGIYATEADVTLVNCLLSGNFIGAVDNGFGAGIYATNSNISVTNCTLSKNKIGYKFYNSHRGAGIFLDNGSVLLAANTILWGNIGSFNTPEEDQIDLDNGSSVVINYCDVESWSGQFGGSGNIGDDPLFIDPDGPDGNPGTEDDDLRLSPGSPCIDAADNTALPQNIDTDLDGNPRYFDDPNTKDSGIGDPPIVDMGSYEFQDLDCPWDLDGSGSVGTSDLLELFAQWGTPGTADFDGSGAVNTTDLLILFANWGPCV